MGYIEETGAARLLRDARIAPIYEGTNGIQAIDLVMRKLPQSGGAHVLGYIDELGGMVTAFAAVDGSGRSSAQLASAVDDLRETTRFLQGCLAEGRMTEALAAATPYLRQFALTAGGAYLAKGAQAGGEAGRVALCRFFADNVLPEAGALKEAVLGGAASIDAAATLLSA